MVTKYKIQAQLLSINKPDGTRINFARKSGFRDFKHYKELSVNIRNAIQFVLQARRNPLSGYSGGIVVIRKVVNGHSLIKPNKIFEAKIGTDGKPFTRFVGITGNYWKRQLGYGK